MEIRIGGKKEIFSRSFVRGVFLEAIIPDRSSLIEMGRLILNEADKIPAISFTSIL